MTFEEVRIIRGGEQYEAPPQRSDAQKVRDTILNTTEEKLRAGRDLIEEGLEMFSIISVPQHKHLSMLIDQVIDQVIEYRRVHL